MEQQPTLLTTAFNNQSYEPCGSGSSGSGSSSSNNNSEIVDNSSTNISVGNSHSNDSCCAQPISRSTINKNNRLNGDASGRTHEGSNADRNNALLDKLDLHSPRNRL